MSTKKNSIDMLHGPLPGKIILFAIPLALSSILQQLFNSADAIVAGRFIGSTALAAIGGVSPVITLLIGLFVGLSIGANVAIAIHIGHKELDRVHGAVQTTAIVTLVSSVALTALGVRPSPSLTPSTSPPMRARRQPGTCKRILRASYSSWCTTSDRPCCARKAIRAARCTRLPWP